MLDYFNRNPYVGHGVAAAVIFAIFFVVTLGNLTAAWLAPIIYYFSRESANWEDYLDSKNMNTEFYNYLNFLNWDRHGQIEFYVPAAVSTIIMVAFKIFEWKFM